MVVCGMETGKTYLRYKNVKIKLVLLPHFHKTTNSKNIPQNKCLYIDVYILTLFGPGLAKYCQ